MATVGAIAFAGQPQRATAATEYEIKAVYLLNLAKSIAFPSSAFGSPDSKLVIGVLGNDPFGTSLVAACRGETANGREIEIRRLRSGASLNGCHIVFVSDSERGRAGGAIRGASGRPILLIGDFAGFAGIGGHFNFVIREGTVRLEYNTSAADRSGLKIPSKIQRLGTPADAG